MKPTFIIIGLGNPGIQYEKTRHNIGFRSADKLADEFVEESERNKYRKRNETDVTAVGWQDKQKFNSYILEGYIVNVPILIAKPKTYMNLSGEAAKKLIDYYNLDPQKNLLVICDDIDLPLGELRLRKKGGAGTHNGLKSLVDVFGEDFPRLRIGIGAQPVGKDLSAWVLSAPSVEETKKINDTIANVPEIVKKFVMEDIRNIANISQ